jgi:hypothetical protein
MLALILGIRARYKYSPIIHNHGFGMVHARDGRVGHDAHTLVAWLPRIVQNSVQIGLIRKTETCFANLSSVQNQIGTIR